MKRAIALAGLTLGIGACSPHKPPPQRVALDCPRTQGALTRASIAPDGRSCAYVSANGDQVSLRLIPVSTSAEAALAPIEAELQADNHSSGTDAAAAVASAEKASATAEAAADRAQREAAADAGSAAARAHADKDSDDDDSDSDADSDKSDSSGSGNVTVNLPGVHIQADNGGAQVHVAGVDINAGENGAVVRSAHDVRLRGEALSPVKRGYRASYILAGDNLAGGYKAEGYEAAGPKVGPLAVAVVKSHSGEHDRLYHDVKALVRRNGDI